MASEAYKVFMGDPRPADAQTGRLDPKGGHSIIQGTAQPIPAIGGNCMFANRSVCWGRRLIKGKVPQEGRRVQPTDTDYSGEIEWMKWGAAGGSPINIRYKRGCSSIDYDYQVTQLLLPKYSDEVEDNYLIFPFGENNIFYDSDAVKVEFLKVAHHNDDSVSKSPDSTGQMYHEIKALNAKTTVKEIDESFDAQTLVKGADTIERLKTLFSLISKKEGLKVNDSDENSVYDTLIVFARNNGPRFMEYINEYKRRVSDLFERAKSFHAFDLTKDGTVKAGLDKKEELLTEVPGKGEDMLDWMFQNCLEPKVVEAVDKLIHISQKFK